MRYSDFSSKIIKYLLPYKPERIGIFGSYARNEQTSESDIDIMLKLRASISLFDLVQIKDDLTKILGVEVDIMSEGTIVNRFLKKSIEEDMILIYGEKK